MRSINIVRQIALTGCRRGEIIILKRSDVDLHGGCLCLSESKGGRLLGLTGLPQSRIRGCAPGCGAQSRVACLIPFTAHYQDILVGVLRFCLHLVAGLFRQLH